MQNNYNYDTNIENSRNTDAQQMSINNNPYINQVNNRAINTNNQEVKNSSFNNGDFIKGALLGASLTFLLTNKTAQETIMKAASKGSQLFQAGMEELKERYEDAQAEASSK